MSKSSDLEAPVRDKCCGKCAFRRGSPERCIPSRFEELMMEIGYRERVFYCHETAEGHFQAVPERVAEGLQVCAGFAAHRANGFKRLLDIQQPLSEIDFTKHRAELERHGVKFPKNRRAA